MSCPNPSAHPVGVRHARETARSCSTVGSVSSLSSPERHRARCRRPRPGQQPDVGRTQHRRRPDARRPSLPRGGAGLGALQRPPARARRSLRARPRAPCRPTSAARSVAVDDVQRPGRGLDRPPVPGRGPLHRRPGRRLRRPQRLPRRSCRRCRPSTTSRPASTPTTRPSSRRWTSAARPPTSAPPRSPPPRSRRPPSKADGRRGPRRGQGAARQSSRRRSASELLSRGGAPPGSPPTCPASGRAAAAVRYALAQVGDAYVYGAAGPNAFDCSGLTMMAWAQAGVGLPALLQRPVRLRPARLGRVPCSPATWSSTTARSATSASTSATA